MALAHRPVDIVPYQVNFTVPARRKMAEFYGTPAFEAAIGNHLAGVSVIRIEFGKRDAQGYYTDEFGVRWNRSVDIDIGMPSPCITAATLDKYRWPDPAQAGRFDRLVSVRREQPDRFVIMGLDFSLFERAWSLVGMEDLLSLMASDPGFVRALLERIVQFNIEIVHAGLAACPDVDGVIFGDDFGTQNGLMMGPRIFRELIAPCIARQYAAVRRHGKKVFIHSCGKVDSVFDDLVALGVECFNPFQPEVMDIFALKRRYAGRLAFYGGISTQRLLPYGSATEVREKVAELLARLGRSGGYIAAPAHAIPGDAPAENIHAMIETLQRQKDA